MLNVDISSGGSHVARSGEQNVVEVQSVRLDDFLSVTDQTLFFKIDVEEHELAVFEGATRLLENNRCLVQVESFGEKAEEVKTFFKSIGYEFRHNFGPDYFFDNFRD